MFSGRRREEVQQVLPQNYQLGQEPSGPCAYEIAQFLQCAANRENLQECDGFNEALRDCKRRNSKDLPFVIGYSLVDETERLV
ncbi:unnamed protein product [Diatraea saccharalis]|uniref:CHCH domain-containing protein n=1 Tax=Diatraea saccharalis TaxID=40085 RepID=A0A9N9WCV5_9NEOP|nr:unnamed protein product [Diatraea saccharalis]